MNDSLEKCPPGYHKRRSYTIKKTGKRVPAKCIRSTTIYAESSRNFKNRIARESSKKLRNYTSKNLGLNKACPRGYLLRKPYIRKYQSSTKKTGFEVKRGNKTYRVYPTQDKTLVKATCIKDLGLPGSTNTSIGPLRKGDLSKYGYVAKKSNYERHAALNKAIAEYGALGTYRKLNAVAKLSVRRAPGISRIFEKDRDWIRKYHSLKAF